MAGDDDKKGGIVLVVLAFVVLALAVGLYFFLSSNRPVVPEIAVVEVSETVTQQPNDTSSQAKKSSDANTKQDETDSAD